MKINEELYYLEKVLKNDRKVLFYLLTFSFHIKDGEPFYKVKDLLSSKIVLNKRALNLKIYK